MTNTLKYIFFFAFLLLGLLLSHFYRPFIYQNKIFDFGIADVGSNLFVIPVTLILLSILNLCNSKNSKQILLILVFISVSHEILSYYFNYFGTFDWKDIIAYLLSLSLLPIISKIC
jgi:hypothetical protein